MPTCSSQSSTGPGEDTSRLPVAAWFSDTSRSYSSCHEQKLHSVNQRGDLDKLEAGRVANANAKSVFITTSLSIVTGGAAVGIIWRQTFDWVVPIIALVNKRKGLVSKNLPRCLACKSSLIWQKVSYEKRCEFSKIDFDSNELKMCKKVVVLKNLPWKTW